MLRRGTCRSRCARKRSASASAFRTMERDSIRLPPAASGCWAWRSACAMSAAVSCSIPSAAAAPCSAPNSRSRCSVRTTDMGKIRILLADDHNVMRDGLRVLLERHPDFEVVAEAADGLDAVRRAQEHAPDVAVMDIAMPTLNGIEATRRIVESHPATAVVILSMHVDESYVLRSLKAGARGYLLKDSAKADLINAIQA